MNLRQEAAVKGRSGERVEGPGRAWPRQAPRFPRHPLFTHTEISDNFTALLSVASEKGTDSFLVTHPASSQSGCYHGKIQTFGILSGLPLSVVL